MIIYNVTTHVSNTIIEAWLDWMKNKHIPEILKTECFTKFQLVRLLETDETEGQTYATQYYAENEDKYREYLDKHANRLREDAEKSWGNKIISFRSIMEILK
jgi:hypothetical protein